MKPISAGEPRGTASPGVAGGRSRRGGASKGPSVLLICAFFLGLGSIAVAVVGGHFPWFVVAPLLVLLMFVHVRRIEAKFSRKPGTPR